MATESSLFDNGHRLVILIPARDIGQTCIDPGHLNVTVAQELLETFQAHTSIQQLTGKGVSETVQRIAFLG